MEEYGIGLTFLGIDFSWRNRYDSHVKMSSKINDFTGLKVWQRAHALVLGIYQITQDFPKEEKFGLVSQMRRAAFSVPANIAEGFRKRGKKDKQNFYNIAQGSIDELRYFLILSKDLQYISSIEEFTSEALEINRMLTRLIQSMDHANI